MDGRTDPAPADAAVMKSVLSERRRAVENMLVPVTHGNCTKSVTSFRHIIVVC